MYGLMDMCNLALRNDHELNFLFYMLTFSNIFVKHCFHLKGTLIFEERLDLCSVLQFAQLGKLKF